MSPHRPFRSWILACAGSALAACAGASGASRPATYGGQELSPPRDAGAPAASPALAAEPRGTKAYLALCAGPAHSALQVKLWEGDALTPVGGPVPSNGRCAPPSLQLDPAGQPVVAFEEGGPDHARIQVRRWDGSAWRAVGPPLIQEAEERASSPAIALGKGGAPWVAWEESRGDAILVLVARLDGEVWRPVGRAVNGSPGPAGTGTPALALDSTGAPVVAWQDGRSRTVRISRLEGEEWEDMGAPLQEPGATVGRAPALALDPAGYVLAAFVLERGAERAVPVLRWDGRSWGEVGEPIPAGQAAAAVSRPALATDRWGVPVVAFPRGGAVPALLLSRWDGDGWSDPNQPIDGDAAGGVSPALGVLGDGTVLVGWQEPPDAARSRVRVRRGAPAPRAVAPAWRPDPDAPAEGGEEQR